MLNEIIYEIFGLYDYKSYLEIYNPNFIVRNEQNKLVFDMLRAFKSGNKHILMEAPTGTGKTFIYTYISFIDYIVKMINSINNEEDEINDFESLLLPLIKSNKIVIVTNNKSLQKQIYNDIVNFIIPSLESYFQYKEMDNYLKVVRYLKVGIYKSKSNYLCRKSLENEYKNKDKDTFYKNVIKEINSQNTDSIDFDIIDKYYSNGNVKFKNEQLNKYNAKNRSCKNCKIEKCKFNKSKNKDFHNIMITNYDYLLLLSTITNLDYIHTLILDEVHNLPSKLINMSNEEMNLTNFINKLPINDNEEICRNFNKHLSKLLSFILKNKKEEDLYNITYGINQNDGKNLETPFKKLKKLETISLLNTEINRVKNYLINIYFKDIKKIIDIYKNRFYFRLNKLLKDIDSRGNNINQYLVLTEYDKLINLCDTLPMENFKEEYTKPESRNITLTEKEIEILDNLFSKDDTIKESYEHCKNYISIIKNLFIYYRIQNEMKDYIFYLKDLIHKLEDKNFEINNELSPDVITISISENTGINFLIMNDNIKKSYSRFLNSIPNVRQIVYCSATISIEEDYSFFMNRLGLLEDYSYKCYIPTSPFDVMNKRYLFLDKKMCLDRYGKENKYKDILKNSLHKIVTKSNSGSLVLCTSKVDVDNSYECLNNNITDNNYSIHSQYYSSLPTIIDDMNKSSKNTVVIGNTGFWEGLDFKGDNMTTLIITKLPYMRVNEPSIVSEFNRLLFDKIETGSTKSFIGEYWRYYTNMMKVVFYQGIGRLIRSVTDYGVIVCLFSYDNFKKKFNVFSDKHLGIVDSSLISIVSDFNMLETMLGINIEITKENSNKYRKTN